MSEQMKWAQRWSQSEDGEMVMNDRGSWVEHAYYEYLKAENARLKAEVERLKQQVDYWRIESDCNHGRWLRCLEDLEHLRASSFVTAVPSEQYERVIKAGDEMALNLTHIGWNICVKEWNAAKEGKQSK